MRRHTGENPRGGAEAGRERYVSETDTFKVFTRAAQRAFVREKVNLSTYPAHPRLPVPRPWIAKGGTVELL